VPEDSNPGGHYLFFVKGNQPGLLEAIQVLFADHRTACRTAAKKDRHGDRFERRIVRASSELREYLTWPGLEQVLEVTHEVTRHGERTVDVRYAITSLAESEAGPRRLLQLVRGHWGIENRLHYVRDVTFDEDRSTVRTQACPQAMAALRNAVIGFLHGRRVRNIAAELRRNAGRLARVLAWVTTPSRK
jgi:hypothetical protein